MNSHFENYGLMAIQTLNERLLAWHQKYTWKLKSIEEIEANSLALSAIET